MQRQLVRRVTQRWYALGLAARSWWLAIMVVDIGVIVTLAATSVAGAAMPTASVASTVSKGAVATLVPHFSGAVGAPTAAADFLVAS